MSGSDFIFWNDEWNFWKTYSIEETEEGYLFKLLVPGIDSEDIKIDLLDFDTRRLKVSIGSIEREFYIPNGYYSDPEADLYRGILTIKINKESRGDVPFMR